MVGVAKMQAMLWLLAAVFMLEAAVGLAQDAKQGHNYYDFFVKETSYSRLCKNKTLLTVNGQFPGPTITARRGEWVFVNVHNQGDKNITIHWHGVDQPRNPWYDGPEFITQCPIQPGTNFTYEILLSEEEGTIWWHAHSGLDRAGVHGAFIVHPKNGTDYPFVKNYTLLDKEIPIILGEWWSTDLNLQLEEYLKTGGEIHNSNAHTINGQPGDLYPCGREDTFSVGVQRGKTYLLRIINAGLDGDMFFGVAGHNLTVVGTDGRYLKPFTVQTIMISPGQTMDALLEAKSSPSAGRYYMASKTYLSNSRLAYQNGTATAILEYKDAPLAARRAAPVLPNLPNNTDDAVAIGYTAQLRSLASKEHPVKVPTEVDEHMLITLAINTLPCTTGNGTCDGPGGTRLAASLNNASFEDPHVDILDAYYYSIQGVYEPDFPNIPPFLFNFTNTNGSRRYWPTKRSTKVKVLEYGAVVEIVFQDTDILGAENHPMHLHGYAFYVVGRGLGVFNETTDPATYNLVDPPYQNTVTVPKAGWVAMRFKATNPGVWFMHCHFDRHTVFGMSTSFIVKQGDTPESKMRPRPTNMPKC
ncbi:putative laccase-9 [Lolium perenne]|uniref:putative laccase-9 n=1 Tax=Lolium perenne TaxID=4522 RepID=UPI0021EA0338|nr:putative laccase-9 [Lolium perenne]